MWRLKMKFVYIKAIWILQEETTAINGDNKLAITF